MSRFKTAAITPFQTRVVFKRKGSRVRYIDPATAKVSGWERDPDVTMAEAKRALIERVAEKNRARSIQNTAETVYSRMTVAELRALAGDRGIKVPSKARKADIIAMLAN
jgi:hypothetical protein